MNVFEFMNKHNIPWISDAYTAKTNRNEGADSALSIIFSLVSVSVAAVDAL